MEKNLNKHMYKFVQTLWKIFCQFSLKNNLALRPSNSILRHIFNRNTCLCVIKRFCKKIKKILEKEMATHSSILAWRIPQTEEPGRLHTVQGVARVGHDLATKPPPAPKMWYIHTVEYYFILFYD